MRATPESHWLEATSPIAGAPWLDARELVPDGSRLVVVAPHPDDETLMAGALISTLPVGRVLLVAVSDGEASHRHAEEPERQRLGERRAREQADAFRRLGHAASDIRRLRLPDGSIAAHEIELTSRLSELVVDSDVILTTASFDEHPDHDACGRACARAGAERPCHVWFAPVWLWHWQTPDASLPFERFRRVRATERSRHAKAVAMRCFRSQLEHDPRVEATPIVPRAALAHFERDFETFVQADDRR